MKTIPEVLAEIDRRMEEWPTYDDYYYGLRTLRAFITGAPWEEEK